MATILEKFSEAFPELDLVPGDAADLDTMPADSVCGADCVKAIEAGKAYADLLRAGHGPYSGPYVKPIGMSVAGLCLLYICG
jgi:hypothetical protein